MTGKAKAERDPHWKSSAGTLSAFVLQGIVYAAVSFFSMEADG